METTKDDILITGGSSGIGLVLAERLRGLGYPVVNISRRACPVVSVNSLRWDLLDSAAVERNLLALPERPVPQGIVFCHGRGDFGSLEQFSAQRIRQLVESHLVSTLLICRHWLPRMKRLGRGTLIFLGSEVAHKGVARGAVYSAVKFALRGASQALRAECSGSGVRVGIVNPGMVNTPFYDELDFAPGEHRDHALQASDVVDAIMLMLRAPAGSVVDEINLSPQKKVIRRTR